MMTTGILDRSVPPCRRAYFFLRRQEKVAKKKATPGRRPACGGVPSATRLERGLRNSGFALRQCSPTSPLKPALLSVFQGGFNTDQSPRLSPFRPYSVALSWFSGSPSWSAEQRSEAGGSRRALFEGRRPELRSRPALRVAQGSRRSRPRNAGATFFLATFSWRRKKKYARRQGGTQRFSPPTRSHQHLRATHSPKQSPPHAHAS